MNIQNYTSEEALEKIQELLEYDISSYANDDEYSEICDIVGLSVYETDEDIVDEEYLKGRAKQLIDDDWLSAAKNLLSDIDLNANFWRIDGYGWAVNIDASDCEYLRDEIIKELVDMLDEEDMEKYNELREKYSNSD